MKNASTILTTALTTCLLVATVFAQGDPYPGPVDLPPAPRIYPPRLAAYIPIAIREEPGADKLHLTTVQRHNELVGILGFICDRVDGGVRCNDSDHAIFLLEVQMMIIDNAKSMCLQRRLAILEQCLALAQGYERVTILRKGLDIPFFHQMASLNRIEMEILLEKAKREEAKTAPAN